MFNLEDLIFQYDWTGTRLQNLRILVCEDCYDTPQEQLRARILSPDPVPVYNARPEPFYPSGVGSEQTQQIATEVFDAIILLEDGVTGITVEGVNTTITVSPGGS
jgi:hypothetical protein